MGYKLAKDSVLNRLFSQNPNKERIIQGQQVQMQPKKDNTGFNIRKVYKKNFSISKNPEEAPYYSPEIEFEKSHQPLTYSNNKKQKELILDQTVNQAILNSKTYIDLKKAYQENKNKNNQRLGQLNEEVISLRNEKTQLQQEKDRIKSEKKKILEAIEQMKQKVQKIKDENDQKRQNVQHIYESEAEYFNQLLLSMRFQAQYEHNIDPDRMTYEQLLELEQKIGSVSKGLPQQIINSLPKLQIVQSQVQSQQKCTVCYCNFQVKQIMTELSACKHQFHFDCLKTWLMKQKVCPLCKQQIQFQTKSVSRNQVNNQGQNQQNRNEQNQDTEENQNIGETQNNQQKPNDFDA